MKKQHKYYDIRDDIKRYPDAWCYLVWSARGPGKTYSTLRMCIEDRKKFIFIKRTIEDVKMLCASGAKRKNIKFDISPFVPLNRDFGWNIKPVKIEKGVAGFYNSNENDEPFGEPIGYAVALSIASDVKGFDMSECDYVVFDEFIPKKYERIKRNEGDSLLDLYMTIRRDRIERGRGDLKLICLANATSINNPTFNTLEVTDDAALMDSRVQEYYYNRGILMHKIIPVDDGEEKELTGIEAAMQGTVWAQMSFAGNFAYDDFTSVKHQRLKGYQPLCAYKYKNKTVYIYNKDGNYYACSSKNKTQNIYDLSRENEQKKFFYDYIGRLREATIEDKMQYETYTMYDLIVNYKNIFKL